MSRARVMLRCARSLHDARSLTLGCTFWPVVVGGGRYGLPSGAAPEGSGEMELPTQRPGEAEPPTQRSGEAEPAHLGVGWSCSRALDCSDVSMLMVISSSSSGTLVLVSDN